MTVPMFRRYALGVFALISLTLLSTCAPPGTGGLPDPDGLPGPGVGGALSTPANFAVSGSTTSSVSFTWTASTGADTYMLQYSDSNNLSVATDSVTLTGTSGSVTGLTSGTTYYFWLSAQDSTGAKNSSPATAVQSATTALAVPTGLADVYSGSSDSVDLTWDASTGAQGYHVYYSRTDDPSTATAYQSFSTTSGTVTGLRSGTAYYFFVSATASGLAESDKSTSFGSSTAIYVAVTDITTNKTWNGVIHVVGSSSNHYGIQKIRVSNGATLTILPGSVVKFDYQFELIVEDGTLIAEGTPSERISFLAYNAPDYSQPNLNSAKMWSDISVNTNGVGIVGVASFKYADFRDSGYFSKGAVHSGGGTVTIDSCDFGPNFLGAVDFQSADGTSSKVTNSSFHNNDAYHVYQTPYSTTFDITLPAPVDATTPTQSGNTGDNAGAPYVYTVP